MTYKQGVIGSSPISPTILLILGGQTVILKRLVHFSIFDKNCLSIIKTIFALTMILWLGMDIFFALTHIFY